jgi:2-polyprenyl-6-methoxyphenol hydroxylase-like FAD-dependent oxidoreductase
MSKGYTLPGGLVLPLLLLLYGSLPFCRGLSISSTDSNHGRLPRRCVIIGGGPVSLATALTLASAPHSYNVTVLEQTSDAEFVAMYDPAKAYLYNLNPRGLQWIRQFPAVLDRVLHLGYSPPAGGLGKILRIPAHPETPIAPSKDVAIAGNVTFDPSARSVWIPRHLMVELMMTSCVARRRPGEEGEHE